MAMPKNKSPGPDKINMRIIRDCLPVILGRLMHIINSSLLTGVFPDEWKLSEVTPLHKDGDNLWLPDCSKIQYTQFIFNTHILYSIHTFYIQTLLEYSINPFYIQYSPKYIQYLRKNIQ